MVSLCVCVCQRLDKPYGCKLFSISSVVTSCALTLPRVAQPRYTHTHTHTHTHNREHAHAHTHTHTHTHRTNAYYSTLPQKKKKITLSSFLLVPFLCRH